VETGVLTVLIRRTEHCDDGVQSSSILIGRAQVLVARLVDFVLKSRRPKYWPTPPLQIQRRQVRCFRLSIPQQDMDEMLSRLNGEMGLPLHAQCAIVQKKRATQRHAAGGSEYGTRRALTSYLSGWGGQGMRDDLV